MVKGLLLVIFFIYGSMLIWMYAGLKKGSVPRNRNYGRRVPFVSVIVAAHNEENHLPQCLHALVHQDYPADRMEIVLVNDRSTDATGAIAREWSQRDERIRVIYLSQTPEGIPPKKYALEQGIRVARGELLFFTDADCVVPAGWVRNMVSLFSENTAMVVGMTYLNPTRTFWSRLRAVDSFWNGLVVIASAAQGFPLTCGGGNLAYRKSTFHAAGGFRSLPHSLSGDDDLLLHRIHQKRLGKILPAVGAQVLVQSQAPQTWRQLFRQKRRHISASRYYPLEKKVALAVFQGSGILLLALPFLLAIWGTLSWFWAILLPFAKIGVDSIFFTEGSRLFGLHISRSDFLLFEWIFPFALLIFAAFGWFSKITWE